MLKFLFLFTILVSQTLTAAPLGNPKALKGGTFTIGFPGYPKSILFYLSYDEFSKSIAGLSFETLIDQDPETFEFIPLLASAWKISDDKKLFTFKLDKRAKFSDGKPVTAKDVKFTWDLILNPKNKTAPFQSTYESFESCTIIDDQTVQFKAKIIHFKNLEKLAGLIILPEHYFREGDFNKAFNTKFLASGPYTLESVAQNERVVLKRDPNYWGASLAQNIGRFNFDKVAFKSINDYDVGFEVFKRGDVDYFYFISAKMWSVDTKAPQFEKNYIKKIKGENRQAYGTQGIVWNLRKPLFQDVKVRTALSHLMNREKWIRDLMYGNYVMASGVVGVNSEYHSLKNKPVGYDPKKARELLKQAGWVVGSAGLLTKDGKTFEFELVTDNQSRLRYLTLYQEDLKKVGVKMSIRVVDWANSIKLGDDRQFDALEEARSRDVDPADFGVVWGSKEADTKGSVNRSGYKNPELDKLAEQIDETFDKAKRLPLVKKLDEMLGRDQPMSFAWEATYFRLGYWNRYSFPGKGYFNYSQWSNAFQYWWLDPLKDAQLKSAMASGKLLQN